MNNFAEDWRGWKTRRIAEVAVIRSGGTPDRKIAAYWSGDIPWVTTREVCYKTIRGTSESITRRGLDNSSAKLFPPGTVLTALYGQGKTRGQVARLGIGAATNQACAAILPNPDLDPDYLFYYLEHQYLPLRNLSNAGGQANLSAEILANFPIILPPLSEQRRIAAILGTWDAAIEKAERLTRLAADALSARRILLLSARHNRKRSEWRTVTFGDVTEELTSRNGNFLTATSVMGVIKGDGFQPMRERTIGSDLSRYKVVPPSAFAYNPMRLNIGSLAFSGFTTDILVSPDYVVFAAKGNACAPEFLNEVRQSSRWAAWCQQGGAGSVRTRIYYGDLISMPIDLPPLATQKRITAILADLTTRHRTAVRRVELLRRQKTGLMERLLTGKIRVPEAAAKLSPAAD